MYHICVSNFFKYNVRIPKRVLYKTIYVFQDAADDDDHHDDDDVDVDDNVADVPYAHRFI